MPHIEDTFAGFTGDGESFREDVVYSRAVCETLFELGIEYRKLADKSGVEQYEVTTGLNDSAKFIDALTELVVDEVGYAPASATGAA